MRSQHRPTSRPDASPIIGPTEHSTASPAQRIRHISPPQEARAETGPALARSCQSERVAQPPNTCSPTRNSYGITAASPLPPARKSKRPQRSRIAFPPHETPQQKTPESWPRIALSVSCSDADDRRPCNRREVAARSVVPRPALQMARASRARRRLPRLARQAGQSKTLAADASAG